LVIVAHQAALADAGTRPRPATRTQVVGPDQAALATAAAVQGTTIGPLVVIADQAALPRSPTRPRAAVGALVGVLDQAALAILGDDGRRGGPEQHDPRDERRAQQPAER